jgi:hypothetical protein
MPDKPLHNMDRKTWDTVARFHAPVEPTVAPPQAEGITPEHEAGWAASGWSPEAIEMIKRLHASGLPIKLAAVAARDMMGLNTAPPTPEQAKEQEWAAYEKEHPIRANTKKLLTHSVQGAGSALAAPAKLPDAEKISAHRMLKEYLTAQDMQRAGESEKEALWMLARMPGQPLAGQPVYGGPTLTDPNQMNQAYAQQANANYPGKR